MPDRRPLTIGIDARAAKEVPAGRGRVVRELLNALAERDDRYSYRLYCREAADLPLDSRFAWERVRLPDPLWHAATAWRATRACDVFLSTNSYLTLWMLRVPAAAIVHDMIAFVHPDEAQRRAQRIERATLGPAVRRAAVLLCNSQATRDDLVELLPEAAAKSQVIPFAAHPRFARPTPPAERDAVRRRLDLPTSFVLSVGTVEPRKNLARRVEAYVRLPEALRREHPLVVAGPPGWEMEGLLAKLTANPRDVRVIGFVADEDLAALYGMCTAFCYPSLYEGFGLPVLEAMQAGAPTITSDGSSLPEVGGDAAVYVDPRRVESIEAGLREVLESEPLRERLRRAGRERAAGYSWDRAAAEMLAVLERISRS
ncbi:MAG TPA: glycosyltransferase family 1 protein [Solirubrobacteraceae bacterium]|nr:glycosyltransferase family 1 protein [Solirubrobacteraceae bacterium]